jgi:hypothetical protein
MLLKKLRSADINDWVDDGSARSGPHFLNFSTVNFRLKLELDNLDNFSHFGDCVI